MTKTTLIRLNVTEEANAALERVIVSVNDGFTGGKIHKTELVSWVIQDFEKRLCAGTISEIRNAHFDQLHYLESVIKELKKGRDTGTENTENLKSLLAPLLNEKPRRQKRSPIAPAEGDTPKTSS